MNLDKKNYPYYEMGVGAALMSGFLSGYAMIWMRRIGRTIHSSVKPLYLGLYTFVIVGTFQIVLWLYFPDDLQILQGTDPLSFEMSTESFLLLLGVGVCGWMA